VREGFIVLGPLLLVPKGEMTFRTLTFVVIGAVKIVRRGTKEEQGLVVTSIEKDVGG